MKRDDFPLIFFITLAFSLPISISASQILTAILVFYTAFKILKREKVDFSCFTHMTLLVLFMIFPLFSFVNAENLTKALIWYKRHLYIIIFPILIAYSSILRKQKILLLKTFFVATTLSSLVAILQPFVGLHFDKPFNIHTYYVFSSGFLSHPLTYGETVSFNILIGLYLTFKESENKKKRILYLILVLVNFLGLIFSREKMPLIATILVSAIYSVIYSYQSKNLKKAITIVILFIIILVLIPNKKKILWRFQKTKIEFSVNTRAKIWNKSLNEFKKHPILGIGLGNFFISVEKWNKQGTVKLYHAHSNLFEILATTGLIGFLIFSLFHLAIFRDFLLSLKIKQEFLFFLTLLSIFLLYHIEGLTECTFKDTELNLQIFFFLSIFYSAYCPNIKHKDKTCKDNQPSQMNH